MGFWDNFWPAHLGFWGVPGISNTPRKISPLENPQNGTQPASLLEIFPTLRTSSYFFHIPSIAIKKNGAKSTGATAPLFFEPRAWGESMSFDMHETEIPLRMQTEMSLWFVCVILAQWPCWQSWAQTWMLRTPPWIGVMVSLPSTKTMLHLGLAFTASRNSVHKH